MDIGNIVAGILAVNFLVLYAFVLYEAIRSYYNKKAVFKALDEESKKGEDNHDEQHNNSN